jgi:adenylyltransferase/sulfurtransferase
MLTEQELIRYSRQIIMPDWGEKGQEKLKQSKVVVAGSGGLGSSVLIYLAAAGVGKIRIIDKDTVELSNLNRQILHPHQNIDAKKVESARERLESLNPDITIEPIHADISENNVSDLVEDYPIIDATDNLETRFLLNRVAVKNNLPLFHGAVYGFDGRVTTIIPGRTACMKCLYQEVIPGQPPIAGVTAGVVGCLQATEAIKYFLGIGDLLINRLLIFEGLSLKFQELKLKKNPGCTECGIE